MKATPFTPADIDSLPYIQPEGWPDIRPYFTYYTRSSFCFPIKIVNDDKMIGTGTTIIHQDVAWLAHIIVHKEYRKQGIGKLITESLVNSLKSTNCTTVYLLATDLGAPVYEKVGFETETEYLLFKDITVKEKPTLPDPITPYEVKYKKQIAALDKSTSGEERLFHLEEHLQTGFVYSDNGSLKGFYLPSFGDGLIIAGDPAAGLALLKLHLASQNRAFFPKENLVATDYLSENGNKKVSTAKRMRLGKIRPVKFDNIYNRIGGNLG
ncbi:GNAT family N-acetyltransferase [Niastella caeni]|uniref:GNAT family N-acetyltransferase n=1 Tax=Niastella caeni TaxID=2569763 RepID=A0A4V4H0K5_9BACT|nr:GNAT family N-acetyltransferase [Niastella caeni]THU36936.1 GNAT family N-acetyltransferase [Niastella caeni]